MATTNLGKVAVVPKGEYSSAVQYERLDIVQYERSSYLVKQAVIGVTPTDGANYALLAGKGDSSYDVAVNNGFIGTEAEWKLYLKSDGSIQALQQFMTNPASTEVSVPDYGNIPSLQGYISTMFENGGLPATPFATKSLMDASALVDGDFAQVTDDTVNNGLYVKTAGAWVKSLYDPLGNAKKYTDSLATVKPKLINVATDLNTINDSGDYITTNSDVANTANNYPLNQTGVLSVISNIGSNLVTQRYVSKLGSIYSRTNNGVSWSAWEEDLSKKSLPLYLADYQLADSALAVKGFLGTENLNTMKSTGVWQQSSTSSATAANNYPIRASGYLKVFNAGGSSQVFQSYVASTGMSYNRYFNGTSWSDWVIVGQQESYTVKDKLATQNANDLKTLGMYIRSTSAEVSPSLNYPTRYKGVLKVYQGAVTGFLIQEYLSVEENKIYARSFDAVSWTDWEVVGGAAPIIPPSGDSGIAFIKTAEKLVFYIKGVNGSNSIKYELLRRLNTSVNLDAWGISSCDEVDGSLETVKRITTDGVWECAIKAVDNTTDHSGGSHGDEVSQVAYFFVDGVYYPQDFVNTGAASEIKLYQESTIYIEDSADVLCYRKMKMTITKDGINLEQQITYPRSIGLEASWISMLPTLRKANADNTGAQITDTEVRSADGIVIDVSEPAFIRRNITVHNGDSINLSSAVSGISTELIVNQISASDNPQGFVQNSTLYNKIYINGATIGETYMTSAGEVWTNNTTFRVNTRN